MAYYAHSGRADDKSDWQGLKEHLERVAVQAAEMAETLGRGLKHPHRAAASPEPGSPPRGGVD